MIRAGERPFEVDETPAAIERAKEFCSERGITTKVAKIVNKDGRVWVESKVNFSIKGGVNIEACRNCSHIKESGRECKECARKRM